MLLQRTLLRRAVLSSSSSYTSTSSLRQVSTLTSNPHIYIHPHPSSGSSSSSSSSTSQPSLLSYLPTSPPNPSLAVASTTANPPTPASTTENPDFLTLLHAVVSEHAVHDPAVVAQAAAFASQAGSALGSGGMFFPQQRRPKTRKSAGAAEAAGLGGGGGAGGGGAGGASAQGGVGGAGVGGWIHVADQRNPPDWGRVAWPEDILGSLQVDGQGRFVEPRGCYQASGTYRVVTNEGILGLSPFLRDKVVQKLRELEKDMKERAG